jgi:hypothetical protein
LYSAEYRDEIPIARRRDFTNDRPRVRNSPGADDNDCIFKIRISKTLSPFEIASNGESEMLSREFLNVESKVGKAKGWESKVEGRGNVASSKI